MVVLVVEVALMLMPVLGATFFGASIELIGLPVKPGLGMTRGSPKEALRVLSSWPLFESKWLRLRPQPFSRVSPR